MLESNSSPTCTRVQQLKATKTLVLQIFFPSPIITLENFQSTSQNHLTAHERLLEQLRERRRLLGQNSLDRHLVFLTQLSQTNFFCSDFLDPAFLYRQLVRGQKDFSNHRPSASNLLATPKKRPLASSGISLSGRHSSLGILETPKKRQLNRISDPEGRSDGSELRPEFELGTPSKRQGRVYSTIHSLHHAYRLVKWPQKR